MTPVVAQQSYRRFVRPAAWWTVFVGVWVLATGIGAGLWLGGAWLTSVVVHDPTWVGAFFGPAFAAVLVWLFRPLVGRVQPPTVVEAELSRHNDQR